MDLGLLSQRGDISPHIRVSESRYMHLSKCLSVSAIKSRKYDSRVIFLSIPSKWKFSGIIGRTCGNGSDNFSSVRIVMFAFGLNLRRVSMDSLVYRS